MNYGAQLLTLEFSREDESEADLVGMELAARAHSDPAPVSPYGRRWEGQQGRATAVVVHAPVGQDAHRRHPGQPAQGMPL